MSNMHVLHEFITTLVSILKSCKKSHETCFNLGRLSSSLLASMKKNYLSSYLTISKQ